MRYVLPVARSLNINVLIWLYLRAMQVTDPDYAQHVENVVSAGFKYSFLCTREEDAERLRAQRFPDYRGALHNTNIIILEQKGFESLIQSARHDVSAEVIAGLAAAAGGPVRLLADVVDAEPLVKAALFREGRPFSNALCTVPQASVRVLAATASGAVAAPSGLTFTDCDTSVSYRSDVYSSRTYQTRESVRPVDVLHIRLDEEGIERRVAATAKLRELLAAEKETVARAGAALKAATTAYEKAKAELAAVDRVRRQRAEADGKLAQAQKVRRRVEFGIA